MYELLDINGGEKFAKMLVNPNKPDLVGEYISSDIKDIEGKKYREIFLKDIKENNESFVEYKYPTLDNNITSITKLSYFYLQHDWNWIIAQGVYLDKLYKKIDILKKEQMREKQLLLIRSILISLALAFISSIVTYFAINIIKNMILELKDKELQNYKLLSQQSKKASTGEMIENIAHQWKQPLTFISTVASSAKVKSELGLLSTKEEVLEDFNSILTYTNYMAQTIDDFKNFFKEDKSKTNFEIKNIIETALMITKGMIKKNNIEIIKNIDLNIEFFGYKNELIQAIINIISNAKDAMVEKDIKEKIININLEKDDKDLTITIEDNAGGIPETIINNIFNQYFTTKGENGTGIGLYMTKNIIEKSFNGKIKVENTNIGAKFMIILPLEKNFE